MPSSSSLTTRSPSGDAEKRNWPSSWTAAQREVTLTPELEAVIAKDREELAGNFCRGCGYCMPYPQGFKLNTICRASSAAALPLGSST